MERRILIVDEVGPMHSGLIDALAKRGNEVILIDHKTEDNEMGTLNRGLLAAALMSGMAVARRAGGAFVPPREAIAEGEIFDRRDYDHGKGRNKRPHRASNAAALKRAKAKRCNARARASKRA